MQRIHAAFDEPTMKQINKEVDKSDIIRAKWLSSAIGSYLRLLELTNGADPVELVSEMRQTRPKTRAYERRINSSRELRKSTRRRWRKQGANKRIRGADSLDH